MMRRGAATCLLLVITSLANPSLPAHQAPPAARAPATTAAAPAPGPAAAAPGRTRRPTPAPGSVFDAGRLERIDTVVQRYVDDQRIAGAVTLVAERGRIAHLRAHGRRDVERNVAMTTDAIFRIASMSKAVTSVAVMMLVEEGALQLGDPVSKHLPAFKNTTVAIPTPDGSPPGTAPITVPARRAITIRDLLTHTAGISYGAGNPLEAQYKAAGIHGWYFADKNEPIGAVIDRLALLPFDAQPGERWVYGFSTDILGRVVEIASGQPLDVFFQTRIFEPLRMTDTHFFLPRDKASRLATVYAAGPDGRIVRAPDAGRTGQGEYVDGPRACFSGGAGLLSTVHDYARFLQMLLDGGALDGVRLLSPASLALMTSNHVGTRYEGGNLGFGLGFEVVEHVGRAGRLAAPGEYGWGGAYYTKYWVDPADGIVGLLFAQLIPAGGLELQNTFRTLVYQAIVRPPVHTSTGADR